MLRFGVGAAHFEAGSAEAGPVRCRRFDDRFDAADRVLLGDEGVRRDRQQHVGLTLSVASHGAPPGCAPASAILPAGRTPRDPLASPFFSTLLFDSLLEAQVLLEDWRIEYNTKRPRSSLGWLAPAAYAERWEAQRHAGLS